MKRILAAAVAVLLVFSLAGCGPQIETPAGQDSQQTGQDSQSSGEQAGQQGSQPNSQPAVHTDWSKLTPYQPIEPVYTCHPGYKQGGLFRARDDYGTLLLYIGKEPTSASNRFFDFYPLYGLVTGAGQLVCDPLYADISFYGDFLLLKRGDPAVIDSGETLLGDPYSYTLAAADGRWAHELTDCYYAGSGDGWAFTATADGSLSVWNRDGEVATRFDSNLFRPWFGKKDFKWGEEGNPYIECTDGVGYVSYLHGSARRTLYLDLTAGTVADTPPEGYPSEIDKGPDILDTPDPPAVEGYSYSYPIMDMVTGEIYFTGSSNGDGGAIRKVLFDLDGTLLVGNILYTPVEMQPIVRDGLCATAEDGCFCYRAIEDNRLVFRYVLQTNED